MKKLKIFFLCTGLGHVQRGYEAFSRQCFDSLVSADVFDVTLFKGGGQAAKDEVKVWNLPRNQWFTFQVSRVVGRISRRGGAYFTEQLSFFLGFLTHLYTHNPDVIIFSDESLGDFLLAFRKLTGLSYWLLFSNGGPTDSFSTLDRWDHVHQIASPSFHKAESLGLSPEKQTLIPYGSPMSAQLEPLNADSQKALREKLGLPENRKIVLSVGAINQSHKRMEYLISEIAALPEPRPYLVILGHQDLESPSIIQMAKTRLKEHNFRILSVPYQIVESYYRAADIFVLASMREGLGLVFIEAMSHGLPCLAHDFDISRYVLGEQGYFSDFGQPGNLTALLSTVLDRSDNLSQRKNRHRFAYDRFSWDKLTPKYIRMIRQCAEDTAVHESQMKVPSRV